MKIESQEALKVESLDVATVDLPEVVRIWTPDHWQLRFAQDSDSVPITSGVNSIYGSSYHLWCK